MQSALPTLDHDACERARLARDPRFDGRFFIAVTSTGIYCRTICPVRLPRPENVRFFATAAAASEHGFRPCLRCRPELAPDNPYWPQHPPLLRAALNRIEEGLLDQVGVPELAARLGVSPRHLRRLFATHLGSSPAMLATTRRTLFAKRLVSDSNLNMRDIAMAAGFSNVRRFNAAFKQLYGMPPSQIRRKNGVDGKGYSLRLNYRAPLDWAALRGFLSKRAIDGVETVDETGYSRQFAWHQQAGTLSLENQPDGQHFILTVSHPRADALYHACQRARHVLDLDAVPSDIHEHLSKDPLLAPALAKHPGLRVPGCWDRFELCVRAVIGQQVSVAAARTLTQRVVERCDYRRDDSQGNQRLLFPDAHAIVDTSLDGLGLTGRRIATLKSLAKAVLNNDIRLESADAQQIDDALAQLPGFGPWTRAYIGLRGFKNPDAFPAGDIVLRKALAIDRKPLSSHAAEARSQSWRPWRAYAVMALWQHSADKTRKPQT